MKRILASLTCWFLFSAGDVIHACSEPVGPPPVWIVPGDVLADTRQEFWVIFHNYTTFGAQPGTFCACGLTVQGVLSGFEVLGLEILDAATEAPIAGFDFTLNANSATSLENQQPTGAWQGFTSPVKTAIPSGVAVDLHFRVVFGSLNAPCLEGDPPFKLGDTDCNGCIDLRDVCLLSCFMFGTASNIPQCRGLPCPPPQSLCCQDAADVNGDGQLDLGDITFLLNFVNGTGTLPSTTARLRGCANYDPALCEVECPRGLGGGAGNMSLADQLAMIMEGVLVGTDEADAKGAATGGHLSIAGAGAIEIMEGAKFRRGDCDGDGEVRGVVTDAIFLLSFNFLGGTPPSCFAACDADGDGQVRGVVTDAIYILSFNFLGSSAPPSPFPGCGPGSALDQVLGCALPPNDCAAGG